MSDDDQIQWVDGIFEDGAWQHWQYSDDGEGWDTEDLEIKLNPNPNPSTLLLYELMDELIEVAKTYLAVTGRHLPIYGELGELYGEVKYGIKRHIAGAAGSDGRLGNDFVEVKTISPHKTNNKVLVKRAGNFNKLLIVKISDDFKIMSKLIERKDLKKGKGKFAQFSWKDSEK